MDNLEEDEPLHVLNLPQLYQKPPAVSILEALDLLKIAPPDFNNVTQSASLDEERRAFHPDGVPKYLTTIVSSALSWIEDEGSKEEIWSAASARLSERSGRTAMPSISRTFSIPVDNSRGGPAVAITLHEPSLTGDNLGMKTWVSSMLLARRFASPVLRSHLPQPPPSITRENSPLHVLELGSGTGLVGIAAARLLPANVALTDLPSIVPNLTRNVLTNGTLITENGGSASATVLDWSDSSNITSNEEARYPVILAADPLYSPDHPKLLVATVDRWLRRDEAACFVIELPLRDAYRAEVADFRTRMAQTRFICVEEGEETGYDDWQNRDGGAVEVRCWWGVWKRSTKSRVDRGSS